MKEVQIKVYEFSELSEKVKEKLMQEARDFLVDQNFEMFNQSAPEQLKELYGIEATFGYSLSYCQGDGLHFNTKQFLTDKTESLIRQKLTTDIQKRVLTYLKESGAVFCTESRVNRYEYASANDLYIDDQADLAETIAEENSDTPLRAANKALDTILEAARETYLDICKHFENQGYASYDITDEQVTDFLSDSYYYEDGRQYALIGDVE